ncbi:Protein kinase-like domain,AGC-kinase, C-terminal, partial [Cinara cedri]
MKLFDSIISDEIDYPQFLSSKSEDIMKKLLCKDPENRLGSSQRDADEIKAESFFDQIVWSDLLEKKIPAPVIPIV